MISNRSVLFRVLMGLGGGHEYTIYDNGEIEGFGQGAIVLNMHPQLLSMALAQAEKKWASAIASVSQSKRQQGFEMKITVDENCEFITVHGFTESSDECLPIVSAESLTQECKPYRGPDGAVWKKVEPTGAMVLYVEDGRCFYRENDGLEWEQI